MTDGDDTDSGSLLDTLTKAVETGTTVYQTIKPPQATANLQARTEAAEPQWTKYLPWAIGGVVVLILGLLVLRK